MVGWKLYKKEQETKGFKKVFKIPQGVILDKIKAKFNDDESTLTITMPKKAKGTRGGAPIEEVKDRPELVRAGSGSLQIADEKSQRIVEKKHEETSEGARVEGGTCKEDEEEKRDVDDGQEIGEGSDKGRRIGDDEEKHEETSEGARVEGGTCKEDEEEQRNVDNVQEIEGSDEGRRTGEDEEKRKETSEGARVEGGTCKEDEEEKRDVHDVQEIGEGSDKGRRIGDDEEKHEETSEGARVECKEGEEERRNIDEAREIRDEPDIDKQVVEPSEETTKAEAREKGFKLCLPLVAGSTLLLTFVAFVFQMIRSKQASRRRD